MMKNKDFLICKLEKPVKYFLMRVTGTHSGGVITGYLEHDYHIASKRMPIEVLEKQVVCNLGPKPMQGKVYNVEVAPFIGSKHHDLFGTISFLYQPKKEVGARLMEAFDRVGKRMEKKGLEFLCDDTAGDRVWEVRAAKGKYAGMYKKSKKPSVNPHRLIISPDKLPMSEMEYVLYHEIGHHLHLNFVRSNKLNTKWIKIFNTTVKPLTVKKEVSANLLGLLIDGDTMPSDFGSTLDDDLTNSYRHILRIIKAEHAVSVKELDILFEERELDEIKSLWPQRTIVPKRELKPIVSEYSTVNYKELFAETFAFYMTGRKLPQKLVDLLEKCLTHAKSQAKNFSENDDAD